MSAAGFHWLLDGQAQAHHQCENRGGPSSRLQPELELVTEGLWLLCTCQTYGADPACRATAAVLDRWALLLYRTLSLFVHSASIPHSHKNSHPQDATCHHKPTVTELVLYTTASSPMSAFPLCLHRALAARSTSVASPEPHAMGTGPRSLCPSSTSPGGRACGHGMKTLSRAVEVPSERGM